MEEGWERRCRVQELSAATVAELIAPVAAGRALVELSLLSGGLSNTLYRITLAGGERLVLRLTTRDPAACARELAIARIVRPLGVPMPEVLLADPDPDGELPPWALIAWAEGLPLAEALPRLAASPEEARACGRSVGEALAPLSGVSFSECGFFGVAEGGELTVAEPLGGVREGFVGYIRACLGSPAAARRLGDDAPRLLAMVEREAGLFEPLEGSIGLAHSDFKVSNLMVAPDGAGRLRLSAVLDWEFAFAGPPLLDVGMMLRDEARLPEGFAAGFVDGFSSAGGVLPPRWRRTAELLDLANLCGFLAMDDDVERPRLIADARRLALETLARAEGEGL